MLTGGSSCLVKLCYSGADIEQRASGLIRSDVPQKQMSRTKTWRIQTPLHIMQKPALWGLFEWYRLVLD